MESWIIVIIMLALGAIGLGIHGTVKAYKEAKRSQAAEAEREAEKMACLQRHRKEQQGYRQQMIVLGEQSIDSFESISNYLSLADKHLDQAEVDFADGAFAPFWDSIEKAANMLGCFDEGIRRLNDNLSHYIELTKKYEDTPPEFPVAHQSIAKLGLGTATATRMETIVRNAQRNFQFAMIYEQRKTNQLLVAGSITLEQALDQIAWHITTSMDSLITSSVGVMTSTLNESMSSIHSRMDDIAEMGTQHHRDLLKEASERTAREKKALEMLDDIQHGRRSLS